MIYDQDGKSGNANGAVIRELLAVDCLLAKSACMTPAFLAVQPLIFRNTAQWFISMDTMSCAKGPRCHRSNAFYPKQERTGSIQ